MSQKLIQWLVAGVAAILSFLVGIIYFMHLKLKAAHVDALLAKVEYSDKAEEEKLMRLTGDYHYALEEYRRMGGK